MRALLALPVLLCGWAADAAAADIRLGKRSDGRSVITISGTLDSGDDERFARLSADAEDATVYLSGPGGSTVVAVGIGTAIRLRAWETVVPRDATCASACALIWVAGSHRSVGIGGRVGFHASYVVRNGQPFEAGAGNALVGAYLNKLGLRDTAVLFMTSSPPEAIAWLNRAEASLVGIAAQFDSPESMPDTVSNGPLLASDTGSAPVQVTSPTAAGVAPDTVPAPLPDDRMMASLYRGFPSSLVVDSDRPCVRQQCSLSVKGQDSWTGADGKRRRLVIGAAELANGCHACLAVLGVGVFRWDDTAWVPERLVPAALSVGAFGRYGGKVDMLHFRDLDPMLVLHDSDVHFGEIDEDATIMVPSGGGFRQALRVATSHLTGGSCDPKEEACRKRIADDDYSSTVAVTVAPTGGLIVTQTFSLGARKTTSWQIGPDGRSRPVELGGARTATVATPAQSASFAAGAADRRAYEAWFAGLSEDGREGAAFWAGQRSLRNPPDCGAAKPATPQGIAGCADARRMLGPMDARRKVDVDYKLGWNSR